MANVFDYDKSSMPQVYDEARALPEETLDLWLDAIATVAPKEVRLILDLGCGTGRFTAPLARRLRAEAIGVDPSTQFLGIARARDRDAPGVTYQLGTAEAIPVAGPVDVIFMSMVYHHLTDRTQALCEIVRVLAPTGRLLIRNSTREDIDANVLFSFFPQAAAIERRRMPRERQFTAEIEAGGFQLVHGRAVDQVFARNHLEYCDKVAKRGLSALQMISEEDFHSGLARLRNFCTNQEERPVHERVHLFAFKRN